MERCNDLERFVPQHRNPSAILTTTNNSARDTTILLLLLLLLRFPPSSRGTTSAARCFHFPSLLIRLLSEEKTLSNLLLCSAPYGCEIPKPINTSYVAFASNCGSLHAFVEKAQSSNLDIICEEMYEILVYKILYTKYYI